MLPAHIRSLISQHAHVVCASVRELPHLQPIVLQEGEKYDRIDAKLYKEAKKLSDRQITHSATKKGSITYRSYTLDFKRRLVESIRQEAAGHNLTKVIRMKAKEYSIHPKNITRWYHAKELKKKEGGRRALYPEMEEQLAVFISLHPRAKRGDILREAREIMSRIHCENKELFNFSKGWYERFRERLNRKKIRSMVKVKKERHIEEIGNDQCSEECVKMEEMDNVLMEVQQSFYQEESSMCKVEYEEQQEQEQQQ